jgi:hypothetical protein
MTLRHPIYIGRWHTNSPSQARVGRRVWAGLAQIRRLGPNPFFSVTPFNVLANPCKFENPYKLFCASKFSDSSFCGILMLYAIHYYCMQDF